jgi:hypothetical protein
MSGWSHSVLRKRPHRQVVVTGPAEAAQVRAPADHFNQEARAELRLGGEDRRRRRIDRVGRLQRGLLDDRRRAGAVLRHERLDRAVVLVADVVERRDVEASLGGQPAQQIFAIRCGLVRGQQRRDERFAFPGGDDVGKQRQRLRVHERHRAADHHERMTGVPVRSARGQSRQPQQRQHIRVVPLERHREREDVEVGNRRLRLERQQRGAVGQLRGQLALRRQEHALADDVLLRVEQLVHRLEAEVRHRDEVGVRERERHPQPPAVRLADVANLFRQDVERALTLLPVVHEDNC